MNFEFVLPQKIIFGAGSVANTGQEAKKLGAEKALIITSHGMLNRQAFIQVTDALQEQGVGFEVFPEIKPEPPVENIYESIAFVKANNCNLVIGLGGGSVLDVAKKVAADVRQSKIMVTTTAGTGSEVTHESVFKIDGRKKAFVDKNLVPDVAIVDPDLAKTMPPRLTAITAIDALAHASECYEALRSNHVSKTLALEAFELLKRNVRKAVEGQERARVNMSLGSLMAGMAFGNAGTTLGHALSYPLSNRGVPHGEAVAMVLASALEFNGADTDLISDVKEVVALIEPKWSSGWDTRKMAAEVMTDEKHLSNNPRKVIYEDVLAIFEKIRNSIEVQ